MHGLGMQSEKCRVAFGYVLGEYIGLGYVQFSASNTEYELGMQYVSLGQRQCGQTQCVGLGYRECVGLGCRVHVPGSLLSTLTWHSYHTHSTDRVCKLRMHSMYRV